MINGKAIPYPIALKGCKMVCMQHVSNGHKHARSNTLGAAGPICQKSCFLHRVFIECMKEQFEDTPPLVLKVAVKLVPIAIGGMAADVKFVVN